MAFDLYTPVHLVESVENCGLCMRWCFECSSYTNVTLCALALTRAICCDASAKHKITRDCKLPSLALSCTGCKVYWLNKVNWSIVRYNGIHAWTKKPAKRGLFLVHEHKLRGTLLGVLNADFPGKKVFFSKVTKRVEGDFFFEIWYQYLR